jgi:hypothetical protein
MKRLFVSFFTLICFFSISLRATAEDLSFRDEIEKLERRYLLRDEPYFENILQWTRSYEPCEDLEKERRQFQEQLLDFFKFFASLHPIDRSIYYLCVEIFSNYRMEYPTLEKWLGEIRSFDRLFAKSDFVEYPSLAALSYSLNPEAGHYYRYFLHLKQLTILPPWEEFKRELRDMQNWFAKKDRSPNEKDQKPLFLWQGRFYPDAKERLDEERKKLLSKPILWNYHASETELSIDSAFHIQKDSQKVENKILKNPKELFQRFFPWQLIESETRYYTDVEERNILSVAMIDLDGDRIDLDFWVHNDTSNGRGKNTLYFTLEPPTLSGLNALLSLWEIVCRIRPHEKFGDITAISLKSKVEVRIAWFKERLTREGKTKELLDKELLPKLNGLKEYLLKDE